MKAWTDYPLHPLGDEPGNLAPVREVQVLGWDGNKYAFVKVADIVVSIKAGYLYTAPGRTTADGWEGVDGQLLDEAQALPSLPVLAHVPEDLIPC